MHILVCGGAGYIGSHMVKVAAAAGHDVSVVDNLSTGHLAAIEVIQLHSADNIRFHRGDIGDRAWMTELLHRHPADLVMHFCAHSLVGESVENPAIYYENNVASTLTLLQAMLETDHKRLVFSSSAAVYGVPEQETLLETCPKKPINPYGQSKLMVEQILQDFALAYGLNSVSLRYFNAAGADTSATIGEKHDPETHLIPNVLRSVASGGEVELKIFGTDYSTNDGSCVRDYIHVNDIAAAHLLAGEYLGSETGAQVFNLGIGKGFSVLEVIASASLVTGTQIRVEHCGRRAGDPPVLIADASKAKAVLKWEPRFTEIEDIIATAWRWHSKGEKFG